MTFFSTQCCLLICGYKYISGWKKNFHKLPQTSVLLDGWVVWFNNGGYQSHWGQNKEGIRWGIVLKCFPYFVVNVSVVIKLSVLSDICTFVRFWRPYCGTKCPIEVWKPPLQHWPENHKCNHYRKVWPICGFVRLCRVWIFNFS